MLRKILILFLFFELFFLSQIEQARSQEQPDPYVNFVNIALSLLEDNFYDPYLLKKVYLYNSALSGASSVVVEETGRPCDYSRIPPLMTGAMAKGYFESEMMKILLRADTLGVNKVDVVFGATDLMLQTVDDSHTYFLDSEQTANFQKMMNGSVDEVRVYGFFLAKINETIYFQEVFNGGPANKAGIKQFDQLIAVNNKIVGQMSVEDVLSILHKSKMAMLTIRRNGEEKKVILNKAKVDFPTIKTDIIKVDNLRIGYVKIFIFNRDLFAKLIALPVILDEKNLDGIIIDVRGNHGGYVYVLHYLLEQFLKPGTIAYYTKNIQGKTPITMSRQTVFNCPLVVLINDESFSCSEIFASAIQENNRGVIIGQNTGGAVGYGQMFALPFDSTMVVTVEQTLSKSDKNLEKLGVKPDIFLMQTYEDVLIGKDTLIEKAIDVIKRRAIPDKHILAPPLREFLLTGGGLI